MNRQMKILLLVTIAFLVMGSIGGCGKRPEQIQSEFTEIISAKASPESVAQAAEYIDKYLKKTDREGAGYMLVDYADFVTQYINVDADGTQVQSMLTYYRDGAIDESLISKDESAEEYYKLLSDAYIRVGMKNEKILLELDYGRLYDEFKNNIPKGLASLYEIYTVTIDRPTTENATLQISYKELLQRALSVEELIAEYKEEPLIKEDSSWLYSNYLNVILIGTTNSPNFDYQTGVFSTELRAEYEAFMEEHPDTVTTWALKEYEIYLVKVGYTINYKDSGMSKAFFDNCAQIVSEAEKRVYK